MNNTKNVSATISHSAGLILDYLMDEETIQQNMKEWIKEMYPDLDQESAVSEKNEDSIEAHLYYAASTEYHNRVLAFAALGLLNDRK